MSKAYSRQPPKWAKVAGGSPLGRRIAAHFTFNDTFASSVRGKSGNPVVTAGPTIVAGPNGRYAQGNGTGKIVTDLYPSMLGVAGSSARTIVAEFVQGDTNSSRALLSLGDTSGSPRSQMTLEISTNYRTIRFSTYGSDITYQPWTQSGTSARVFIVIAYDGNVTLAFRSWAQLSNGQLVVRTQTSTLPGPLNTGDTVPLNLMGGGTYNFASMNTALYHLSIYGGRALSAEESAQLYADRHQVMERPAAFPYASLAAAAAQPIAAALAWTEADDVAVMTAAVRNRAAITWTEQDDTAALAAIATNRANIQWEEDDESSQLRGVVSEADAAPPPGAVAVLGWTEADDTVVMRARVRNRAGLAWVEQDEAWALQAITEFVLSVRYADSAFMRQGVVRATVDLGPDRLGDAGAGFTSAMAIRGSAVLGPDRINDILSFP